MTTIQLELLQEMKKQQIARTKLAVICTCTGFQKGCFSNENLTIPSLKKRVIGGHNDFNSDMHLNYAMAENPFLPC
jgi:hypothetical protein